VCVCVLKFKACIDITKLVFFVALSQILRYWFTDVFGSVLECLLIWHLLFFLNTIIARLVWRSFSCLVLFSNMHYAFMEVRRSGFCLKVFFFSCHQCFLPEQFQHRWCRQITTHPLKIHTQVHTLHTRIYSKNK